MKATTPVAIQPNTKLLQLRFDEEESCWILWLHHNLQMSAGTFLRLYSNGRIDRVTVSLDGTEDIGRIR